MTDEKKLTMLPLEQLEEHPDNPRKNIGDVTELADSIRESGILQNLTVVPHESKYRVIIGHRRMAAAKEAGLTEVPCAIVDMDYKTQIATMLCENMQRSDLTVVEQAQGIQMMFDFGESVESISKKTGFSQSTVRKRLSVAALPVDETKAAEERGGTPEDFIKVNKIESEKERKKLLNSIGTRDFNWEYKNALSDQLFTKNKPIVEKWCKKNGFSKMDVDDRWSSKFEQIKRVPISNEEFDPEKPLLTLQEIAEHNEFFYCFAYGEVYICTKSKKQKNSKPQKSTAEKKADAARKELEEKFKKAYELRREFVDHFSASKQYEAVIKNALSVITAWTAFTYNHPDRAYLCEILKPFKYENKSYFDDVDRFLLNDKNAEFKIVYAYFCDSNNNKCVGYSSGKEMPPFSKNERLDKLYGFLVACGYQMSSEEIQLMNGTHELYAVKKEKG